MTKKLPGTIDVKAIFAATHSHNTIRTYARLFADYMTYAGSTERAFEPETVQAYQQHLIENTEDAVATIAVRLMTINSIARYLHEEGYLDRQTYLLIRDVGVPAHRSLPHRASKRRVTITPKQMRQICDMPVPTLFNPVPVRDRALLLLLATTGMKVSEARRIQTEDVVRVGNSYEVRNLTIRDGAEPRAVPLTEEVYHAIQDWLYVRGTQGSYVFNQARVYQNENILWNDNPMSADAVEKVIRDYSRMAGIENVKPLDLRRFAGTQMAKRDINAAQRLMGYKSAMTAANLLPERKRRKPMVQF